MLDKGQADVARARVFGERAYRHTCAAKGIEHPDSVKILNALRKPTEHQSYGASLQWYTSIKDKPQGLAEEAFEEWLWQRAVLPRE